MSDSQTPPTQPSEGDGTDPWRQAPPAQSGQPGGYPSAPVEGGYGGMAPMSDVTGPTGPVNRPPAMDTAVRLMKVGAIWSLVQILFVFAFSSQIRDAVEKSSAKGRTPLSADQVDAAVAVSKVTGIAGGLLAAALWYWMSVANGKGRSWARIVATVLGALSVLSFLAGLVQPSSALVKLSALVTVVIGAAALFFMYRRESSEFYAASSRPR